MTEKGHQYQLEIKEKAANSSINNFNKTYNRFHETLRSCADIVIIKNELSTLTNLCHETISLLDELGKLTTDDERAQNIKELIGTVQKSMKSAEETSKQRIIVIEGDRRSVASSRTPSHSSRSSRSTASSAKSAMLKAQARRHALEEKMRFNDAIHEQEKALSKLRLQQEISATRAEEEVYRQEAAQEDNDEERPDVTQQRSPPPHIFPPDEILRGNSGLGTNDNGNTRNYDRSFFTICLSS